MKIVIYSSLLCPYCRAAKVLLNKLKLSFDEILIDNKPEVKKQMIKITNRQTVPQIFFDKVHIGGYDDLEKKYKNGELLKLINEEKV